MTSPWLSMIDIAAYLRFVDKDGNLNPTAARKWVIRHVPRHKIRTRGHALLVHRDDLDACLGDRVGQSS